MSKAGDNNDDSTCRTAGRGDMVLQNNSSNNNRQLLPPPSSGEHRLRSENLAFDIDVWYPGLAEHTFRSVFLPLTRGEAKAMVGHYNASWRNVFGFDASMVDRLVTLEARIDQALTENFPNKGAFLRLCGRSPKDGEPTDPRERERVWKNYQEALETLRQARKNSTSVSRTVEDDQDGNLRVAAISHTESWLHIHTGAQAMAVLLTSERVFSDLLDWLHYGEPEQVVLREFDSSFDLSTEFRCYIQKGGILAGISQYDTYARHDYLQDAVQRTLVIKAVVNEWLRVKECIETMDGSYCADFGVNLDAQTARLIEISPFRRCTGPAFFAWQGESTLIVPEREDVLDERVTPVVDVQPSELAFIAMDAILRVRSQVVPRIGELVDVNWDYRWSAVRHDTPNPYQTLCSKAKAENLCWWDPFVQVFQQLVAPSEEASWPYLLFVYGTLKRQCHWNSKFMTGAIFLGEARTAQPQHLVIGECGVPYLIRETTPDSSLKRTGYDTDEKKQPKIVRGELWRVSAETLRGIDEYEGIDKGHYSRQEIDVLVGDQESGAKAFCYFYAIKQDKSQVDAGLLRAERIAEYTADQQKKRYKAIHHIQVKQLQYLGEEATT